ncbi:unnamed protein product, partial [Didymodactylos carnosus]
LIYPSSDSSYLQDLYENRQHYLLDNNVDMVPIMINPNLLAYMAHSDSINNDLILQKYWGKLYHDYTTKFNQQQRPITKFIQFPKRTIPIEFQKQLYAHGIVGKRR